MIREIRSYGKAKITNFLPTVPALRYLNCCTTVGWHDCNRFYHQQYPEGVPFVFVLYTVKGCGWLRSGDRYWELKDGEIIVVPEDTPMEYATLVGKASDSWEFYWLNLSGDYVKQTARKLWEDECIVHDCRNKETFRQIFHGMLESPAPQQGQEYEHSCRIQDLFHQLLAELLFERKSPVGNSAENILDHIRQNYASAVTLDELSRRFFLSQNQLIRVFRKRTGYTPYEYLKHYRMAKACELLSGTSFPVGRIGELVGYRNQSHFIAQFHALYGMTPGEYRVKWSPEQQVEIRTGDG